MFELGLIIICVLLVGLNFFLIWFYSRQLAVLIDKAMSRSYTEYVQTKNLEQAVSSPTGTQEKQVIEDDTVLNELNSLFR